MCRHLAWLGEPRIARPRSCSSRGRRCCGSPTQPRRQRHGAAQRRRLGRRLLRPRPARARPLALGPPAVDRRLVRLGGAGAALGVRAGRRPLGDRRACRPTRAPPRRSPTAAGCSRTTAGSTGAVLPARPRRRVGRATPRCSPPTSSPRGPDAARRDRPRGRRRSTPPPGSTCCSPTARRILATTWGDPLRYLVDTRRRRCVASEPWDDDPALDRRTRPTPARGRPRDGVAVTPLEG